MKWQALMVIFLWCATPVQAQQQVWNFQVLLDGKPIGMHRFEVTTAGEQRTVRSQAQFAVKFLGLTVHAYQHMANEHWQGDCLRSLESATKDGRKSYDVDLHDANLPSCIMSYAYWNPELLRQTQLVNTQTGKIDRVTLTSLGMERIEVRGALIAANRWRLTGLPSAIDLWYAPQTGSDYPAGTWLKLESQPDGRLLSYQLQ